jgi:outer membrane protein assembly factor BamB
VDGAVLWKRTFPSHAFREHPDNSYAASTPALDGQRVYVCWNTPEEFTLMALNQDGTDAWKADLGPFVSQHGGGNSPIVFHDMVVLGNDQEGRESFLAAFDCKTGTPRWKVPRQSSSFSAATPCIVQPEGGSAQIVFTSRSQGMTGIEAATGRVVWSMPDAFDTRTIGSPVTLGGLVFATCGEGAGGHRLVAVNPGMDGSPAKLSYRLTESVPYVPTPLVKGDLLFVWTDSGAVTCAHAGTGKKIWQERVGGSFYGSPVCAGDHLFCISRKGEVVVLAASEKFQLLGRNPLGEKCHTTPAIAEGRMYVRTYSHLYCIGSAGSTPPP